MVQPHRSTRYFLVCLALLGVAPSVIEEQRTPDVRRHAAAAQHRTTSSANRSGQRAIVGGSCDDEVLIPSLLFANACREEHAPETERAESESLMKTKARGLRFLAVMAIALFTQGIANAQAPRPGPPSGMPGLQPAQGVRVQAVTNLVLVSPPANAVLQPGSSVTIAWTGGVPGWKVNLTLIDVTTWAGVVGVAGNIPNSNGTLTWVLPMTLDCSHKYEFYIAEVSNITWNYGPIFTIKCDIELTKTRSASSYTVTIVNKGSRFTGPATIAIVDVLPTGLTVVSGVGAPNASAWTLTPVNAVGPSPVNITYAVPAGMTIASNAPIGSYTLLTAISQKNCAKATLSFGSAVVPETTVANNSACVQ